MASKPLKQNEKPTAAAKDPAAAVGEDKELTPAGAAKRVIGDTPAAPSPSDDDEDEELADELELDDDDDDEDLVVFTAKEAAGALATVYGFVKPYLANYKTILAFVGLGVVV